MSRMVSEYTFGKNNSLEIDEMVTVKATEHDINETFEGSVWLSMFINSKRSEFYCPRFPSGEKYFCSLKYNTAISTYSNMFYLVECNDCKLNFLSVRTFFSICSYCICVVKSIFSGFYYLKKKEIKVLNGRKSFLRYIVSSNFV